jgi:beta-glucosidase
LPGEGPVARVAIPICSRSAAPAKEFKGFTRAGLLPGETRAVALEITPASPAFYNVESGEFEVMTGTSSRDPDLQKSILTVTK